MKEKNLKTIVRFEADRNEYKPVKNAISEELEDIVRKVYQLDSDLGHTLS